MSKNLIKVIPFLCVGIFLLLSILFFALSKIFSNSLSEKKRLCTQETLSTVTKIRSEESFTSDMTSNSNSYYFTYQYDVDGEKVEQESKIGSPRKCFAKGDKVKLYYNPNNVRQIYVPNDKTGSIGSILKFIAIVFAIVDMVAIMMCIFIYTKKI